MSASDAVFDGIECLVQALTVRRGDVGEVVSGESTLYRLDGDCPVCGHEQGRGQRAVAGERRVCVELGGSSVSISYANARSRAIKAGEAVTVRIIWCGPDQGEEDVVDDVFDVCVRHGLQRHEDVMAE